VYVLKYITASIPTITLSVKLFLSVEKGTGITDADFSRKFSIMKKGLITKKVDLIY
jgi:hypothetical protein